MCIGIQSMYGSLTWTLLSHYLSHAEHRADSFVQRYQQLSQAAQAAYTEQLRTKLVQQWFQHLQDPSSDTTRDGKDTKRLDTSAILNTYAMPWVSIELNLRLQRLLVHVGSLQPTVRTASIQDLTHLPDAGEVSTKSRPTDRAGVESLVDELLKQNGPVIGGSISSRQAPIQVGKQKFIG